MEAGCHFRSPLAVRMPTAGARVGALAGVAARVGVEDKTRRYGPSVTTMSWETFGRLHAESAEVLEELARRAACGSGREPQRLARAWRAAAERAMLFAEADGVLLSLGSEAARHAAALRGPGLATGAGEVQEAGEEAGDRRMSELVEGLIAAAQAEDEARGPAGAGRGSM